MMPTCGKCQNTFRSLTAGRLDDFLILIREGFEKLVEIGWTDRNCFYALTSVLKKIENNARDKKELIEKIKKVLEEECKK